MPALSLPTARTFSVLEPGFPAIPEPEAVALKAAREMAGLWRRIRIVAANLQQLQHFVAPLQPLALFFCPSQKVILLVVPCPMLAALVASVILAASPAHRLTLAVQLFFCALAAVGLTPLLRPVTLRLPYYFCMVNSAETRHRMVWE